MPKPEKYNETPDLNTNWLLRLNTFKSLRHRDYRFLWAGNFFSFMALWLQVVTLGWLVWELTIDPATGRGSAFLSSTVAGLRAVPSLFVGPVAGVLLDRMDRRRLVIIVQCGLATVAVVFALIVATDVVRVWHVFVYAIVAALFWAVLQPARYALIVNTVPRQDIQNAFALNALTVTSNRLVGALMGGILITTIGIKWNFFVEAGAHLSMALLLIPMRTPYREESTAIRSNVFSNLKEGAMYIWREDRIILHLITMNVIVTSIFLPLPALLPAYTSDVLGRNADIGGVLMAAMGAGGVLATILIASKGFFAKKGLVGLVALVFGSGALLLLAQSYWLTLSLVAMAIFGVSQSHFMVSNQTLVQSLIPDALRGRITSIWLLENALGPLAIFFTGIFMDFYSTRGAMTFISSGSLIASLFLIATLRQVRRLE